MNEEEKKKEKKKITVEQVMSQGIVFKKAKETVEPSEEKNIRFSNYLKGTHRSGAAKMKAEYKYKRALRGAKKRKKS